VNLVAAFEDFIERLMERTFTRATRSHLQPVEISKRLVRAMESRQSVGVEGIMVPNVYDVYLSTPDYSHFEPARRSVARDLETHLGRSARQRHFHLVSRPVVTLQCDPRLSSGSVQVVPSLQDVEVSSDERQHTAILPQVESAPGEVDQPEHPALICNGQPHAVVRSPTRVGRFADNDIVFDDKRVSRYHAEIANKGSRWALRDVGSTNGTAVNDKIVKEILLKPGDTISLGGLEVTWEQ
jgi:hypothetical protein